MGPPGLHLCVCGVGGGGLGKAGDLSELPSRKPDAGVVSRPQKEKTSVPPLYTKGSAPCPAKAAPHPSLLSGPFRGGCGGETRHFYHDTPKGPRGGQRLKGQGQ